MPTSIQLLSGVQRSGDARGREADAEATVDAINLPEQPMALIGRDGLLDSVVRQLARPEVRLLTLTGSGGAGKTRLACEVAQRAAPDYDRARYVDLAPLDSDLILASIADAIGAELHPSNGRIDQLSGALRTRRTLLLLDNFEHVLDAAPQVANLLAASQNLNIIVTSREPLRLRWEHLVRVPPLALPELSDGMAAGELADIPAVALFVSHIQRVHPQFTLTEENGSIIAEICQRLDGLPLALELAAAKLRVCSLPKLRDQLKCQLDVGSSNLRDLPARQRSLPATIEWSYQRLEPVEQLVARQAAIFGGGGSVEAAAAVIELAPEAGPVEDILVSLAEKSLIDFDPSQDDAPRFTMLNTVRAHLLDQPMPAGEETALQRRFATYYVELAACVSTEIGGDDEDAAIQALDRERENFRSILQAASDQREPDAGLRLAVILTGYWYRSGQLAEAIRWFERLLPRFDTPETLEQRIEALRWAGRFALFQGDIRTAARHMEEALQGAETIRGAAEMWEDTLALAHVRLIQGDAPAAEVLLEAASLLSVDAGVRQLDATRFLRGSILASSGQYEEARRLFLNVRMSSAEGDTSDLVSRATLALADLDLIEGELDSAEQLYREVVADAGQARNWNLEARGRIGLGIVASRQPNEEVTLNQLTAAFGIAERYGDELGLALVIDALATLGLSRSLLQPEWLQFAGLAGAMFERLGIGITTLERQRTAFHHQMVRDILGDDEADRVEVDGRCLSLGYVRAKLDEARPEDRAVQSDGQPGDNGILSEIERLTRREREVVRLIVRGLTNRQIAHELDIAERTVDSHVTNVFRKLEVSSRVSVAAWAVERGLASR